MHQVGFAPAASITVVRLTLAVFVAVAVFAVGLLSGPATASADTTNNCSNTLVNVACVGEINGGLVNVTVNEVVSGNELTALTTGLQDVFLSVVNISDINILSVVLTTQVQTLVRTVLNTITKLCQVFVTPPTPITGSTSVITIACS